MEKKEPFVKVPLEIALAAKLLSAKARVVYLVIKAHDWGDKSPPSFRTIQAFAGLGAEAVAGALRELAAKRIVECISGQSERVNNRYRFCEKTEWDFFAAVETPTERRFGRKPKPKGRASKIEAHVDGNAPPKTKRCFENRNTKGSKIEATTASKIEDLLDLPRSRIKEESRRGTSIPINGAVPAGEGEKGVLRTGSNGGEKGAGWSPANFSTLAEGMRAIMVEYNEKKITLRELDKRTAALTTQFGKTPIKKVSKGGSNFDAHAE